MNVKHLISISDLSSEQAKLLIYDAAAMKKGGASRVLEGKVLALVFEKPSLRTRVSFDIAIHQLGGYCLYLSPQEVGLGTREPVPDVARVLGRYLDGIVARTFAHQTVRTFAQYAGIPVINALSDWEHPCQALADMLTIFEKKGKLQGLNLTYVGDGNNVANSLVLAAALLGMNFTIAAPTGYELNNRILRQAQDFASRSGSTIMMTADPRQAVKAADIIYTDVWTSMGQEDEAARRRHAFASYQVGAELLEAAPQGVLFMHPLPAHQGEEIASGLLEHPSSVVFDQAENRLHIQKAILVDIFRDAGRGI